MKKTLALLLALVMLFALAACGSNSDAPGTSDSGTDAPEGAAHSIIYFAIRRGDLSFNDAGYTGCETASQKYGWNFKCIELGDDTSTYENAIADALDSGDYDIAVAQNGYGLGDLFIKYSTQYPAVKFIFFDAARDADLQGRDNLYGIFFNTSEAGFLAGALSAKMTTTGKVGAFIYNDVPGGNDLVAGFLAGMQHADPAAQLYLAYGGGMAGPDQAYEVVNAMVGGGADVILGYSGRAFSGMVQALTEAGGVEKGYYALGPDTDMYISFSQGENSRYADVILTSVLKNIANALVYACDSYMDGTIEWGKVVPLGVIEDGTGLADNAHYQEICPQEVREYINSLISEIKAGTLEVPTYYDFADYDAFVAWRDSIGVVTSY